jgi:putative ABC transport system permease protein
MIGLDMNRVRLMGWRLFGKWPETGNEVIAGINLKTALGLREGAGIRTVDEGKTRDFIISGFIEKGGAEDSALIMSVSQAWDAAGGEGRLQSILIRGKAGQLEQTGQAIRVLIPDAMIRTVRQVAMAEESLLAKIQLLMVLVTLVVLFAASVSVASTMGANVLERRQEIGLMKALGATRRGISAFYMTEAVLIGIAGGSAGFVVGFLSAQAVSKGAFNSFIGMPLLLPAVSLVMGVMVSLISSYFPVSGAMKFDPAVILRGE